jgi:hypothetical protein
LDQELPSPARKRRRSSILPEIQPLLFGDRKEGDTAAEKGGMHST